MAAVDGVTVLLLPALTIYLGFNAGGYFAGSTAWACLVLIALLAVRIGVSGPRIAPSGAWPATAAIAALTLLALWTVLSGAWSGNFGRSLLEFDRTLLYLLVLVLFGSIQAPRTALRLLPAAFALAAILLCAGGLLTRTLPGAWPFELPPNAGRLAYPITYSNGLGLLAALGLIACLHGASWERGRAALRIASAAALPLLAATLMLTFSRGAFAAGSVGLLAYLLLARPRGLPVALIAGVPAVYLAASQAYGAELLTEEGPATAATLDQGRHLALAIGAGMVLAALLIAALIPLERRLLERLRGGRTRPPRAVIAGLGVLVVAAAVIWLPAGVDRVREEIDRPAPTEDAPIRARLTDPSLVGNISGQNRLDYWRASLDAFSDDPIKGTGVGGFTITWALERPFAESVTEGHSVYLETLGELGLVGEALLVAVLISLLVAAFVARRDERPLFGVLLAMSIAWMLHAAIDWDWELPALSIWIFATAGCGFAAWGTGGKHAAGSTAGTLPRVLGVAACLMVALTPLAIARSQSLLDRSSAAFKRGDCASATTLAADASSILPMRFEPFEIRAYCLSRAGGHKAALAAMDDAIDRSPHSWELVYGLALIRAAAGEDPRPTLERARALNPLEPTILDAVKLFTGDDPARWRRDARRSVLPPL